MAKRIRFIGNQPRKDDNVYGSGMFWTYPGDSKMVSNDELAMKFLRHPDIWEEVSKNHKPERIDPVEYRKAQEREPEPFVEPSPPRAPELPDDLMEAIRTLDPENPDHVDAEGKPSLKVLSGLLMREVTVQERDTALKSVVGE